MEWIGTIGRRHYRLRKPSAPKDINRAASRNMRADFKVIDDR